MAADVYTGWHGAGVTACPVFVKLFPLMGLMMVSTAVTPA